MEIGLLISGNLTGFSSFYATNEAKEILKSTKFNFDFHNWITFLRDGDELHAVSFSSNYIAVSLVTNILDSFRRPGNLVVSIMMPRYCDIMETSNPDNKSALYTLLHEINDKFYEKNFINGMVSQNPSALMQDYYSEILSRYSLFTDRKQKCVNVTIDPSSPNKKVGYVASADRDIPNYLSSINRKSYEGFHYVFFAPNAPQNIDEPPVEEIFYRVYITNNGMTLPGMVKLTDPIFALTPERGEIPFEQNYTYGEVLNGNAGNRIRAALVGEMLEMTYRFEEEQKTIHFEFVNNGTVVSLSQVAPVIEYSDGNRFNLPTDSYTFIGKEIYAPKKLLSGSSMWGIKRESVLLNIQGVPDGATYQIQVEQSTVIDYHFQAPYNVPKTIILSRRSTGQSLTLREVREHLYQVLSGNLEEWDYRIDSNEYEPLTGVFPSRLEQVDFQFLKKASSAGLITAKLPMSPVSEKEKTGKNSVTAKKGGTSGKGTTQPKPAPAVSGKSGKKSTLNMKKVFLVAFPVIVLVAGAIFYFMYSDKPILKDDDDVADTETSVIDTVFVNVKLIDKDGNYLDDNKDYKDKKAVLPYVNVEVKESGKIQKNSRTTNDSLSYEFIAAKDCEDDISFEVHFDKNIILCKEMIVFKDLENEVILQLSASIQAINLYKDLSDIIDNKRPVNQSKFRELEKSFNKCYKNSTDVLRDNLEAMLESVNPVTLQSPVQGTPTNTTGHDLIRDNLNSVSLTLEDLNNITPKNENEEERINALKKVLESFKKEQLPRDPKLLDKLSDISQDVTNGYRLSQRQILEDLIETYNEKADKQKNQLSKILGRSKSLYQSFNAVNSLNSDLADTRKK